MKLRSLLLCSAVILRCSTIVGPADAFKHRGNTTSATGGSGSSGNPNACNLSTVCTYWASITGAPILADVTLFPTSVFGQPPNQTTGYTGAGSTYLTLAAAAKAAGVNGFLSQAGDNVNYPENLGSDNGELAAAKAQSMWMIAGGSDYTSTTDRNSPQNMRTVAVNVGALHTYWIGFNGGDEPQGCGNNTTPPPPWMNQLPTAASAAATADSTVIYAFNFGDNMVSETQGFGYGCTTQVNSAITALTYSSFDAYPLENPFMLYQGFGNRGSDGATYPNDQIWLQGMGVYSLYANAGGRPVWEITEENDDALGLSGAVPSFNANVANTSTTLTANDSRIAPFTATLWDGLTVTDSGGCIPANTTLTGTPADSTHMTMSHAATCSVTGDTITLSGGVVQSGFPSGAGCSVSLNLCAPFGNRYRSTTVEVFGEVFIGIAYGATGNDWFADDSVSFSFGIGDPAGGAAATTAYNNMLYVDGETSHWAPVINQGPIGMCGTISPTTWLSLANCTNGTLTISSSVQASTLAGKLVSYNSKDYLIAVMTRHSASGVTATFTASGMNGNAKLCYDSRIQYDNANKTAVGTTYALSGGAFSDSHFGDGGNLTDDNDVKIYVMQNGGTPTCDF